MHVRREAATRPALIVVVPIMTDRRQDLLYLLQRAHVLAQNVEQLLARFREQHATRVALVTPIDELLTQTVREKRVLLECLHRIEDDDHAPRATNRLFASVQQPTVQSEDNALQDLMHAHALILEEIEVYNMGIVAAESSGFFETRFVCEGILTQKYLMVDWLWAHATSHTRPETTCVEQSGQ